MPMLDMPLKELKNYYGISPKPENFDDYWEKALTEMDSINPDISITPANFQTSFANCYDLYFTGVRGARIYAKLIKPKKIVGKCPAVLFFHGYTGDSGDWYDKLPFAAQGYVVAALDCRGQAGKSQDTGGHDGNTLYGHFIRGLDNKDSEDLLMRHNFLDTAQLAKIVSSLDEVDDNRIGVFGGSQGGGLAIACAALSSHVKSVVAYFPFLSDYRRVWDMDLLNEAYRELRDYFRFFDPCHKREDEIFNKLGYIDVKNLAPRIKGSVHMTVTLQDKTCPPSTQFAVYNNIISPKELEIYYDYGHEGLPGIFDTAFRYFTNL